MAFRLITIITLLSGLQVFAADQTAIKGVLVQAQENFADLAVDLPFEKIGAREQTVRERFKTATNALRIAILELQGGDTRAQADTKSALDQLRRVALLIPFYQVDMPDPLIERWLAAEDLVLTALRAWDGVVTPPPTAQDVWRYNGLAWKPLNGQFSLRDAQQNCGAVVASQTAGWHLPSLVEITQALRAMKNPSVNPVFGTRAAQFQEVWTGEENAQAPGTFYFINFQKEDTGVSGPLSPHQVVCVGKDNS